MKQLFFTIFCGAALLFATSSCNNSNTSSTDSSGKDSTTGSDSSGTTALKPTAAKPAWGPSIKDEMQVVIEKLESYNAPPIETLTAEKARQNPTPTTAVMDVIKEHHIKIPAPGCDTMGKDIPVNGGLIHVRIYTPKEGDKFPVIVYYHGGGWVIADLNTYDASAQGLCEQANAVVVSVHYRQGPEHKFPAAHQDAFAAYEWVTKNLASIKGDTMIAVAGESAGGNLACNVSIMARDKKIMQPVHQLLVYPVSNNDMEDSSYHQFAMAKPLNKAMMGWFVQQALPSMATAADPRISLVKANLKGLPPTTLIGAEIDPLASEGALLADKLKAAGVDVDYKLYDGVTHEFFGMALVVPQAKDAQEKAASNLKKAFKK